MTRTISYLPRSLGTHWLVLALMLLVPATARAATFAVDVWTDRGDEAVYRPGEGIEIGVRTTDDAYVLVYEIDAEGHVHLLFPYGPSRSFLEGRTTLRLPEEGSSDRLVVQGPVGEGYVVAIASDAPFRALPWYLRPYNAQAEELGYGDDDDDDETEGVTAEGRIVGDPFVAMERIRRAVLEDPDDRESFSTAYTTYYVHHAVRYPRYLCYDCHRPQQWAWWDGFDPYYTTCSVFDFRVNSTWWWGPSYWFSNVPYYVFVYRPNCPPRYRGHYDRGSWHSSWDGWRSWRTKWGNSLRRFKSAPPRGYVPPPIAGADRRTRFRGAQRPLPPGFMAGAHETRSPRPQPSGVRRERLPMVPDPEARDRRSRDVIEKRVGDDRVAERGRRRDGDGSRVRVIDPGSRERPSRIGGEDAVPRGQRTRIWRSGGEDAAPRGERTRVWRGGDDGPKGSEGRRGRDPNATREAPPSYRGGRHDVFERRVERERVDYGDGSRRQQPPDRVRLPDRVESPPRTRQPDRVETPDRAKQPEPRGKFDQPSRGGDPPGHGGSGRIWRRGS